VGLCANTAQQKIAEYLRDKPDWFIQKYGCQRRGSILN